MEYQTIFREQFFFIADESDVFYNPSRKKSNAKLEKDETRAKLLVSLLDEYGYDADDIQLDFESPKVEILGTVDLAVFENNKPFLAAQFLRDKPFLSEIAFAREALFEKAKDFEAIYAVLAWGENREVFLFNNGKFKKVKDLIRQ